MTSQTAARMQPVSPLPANQYNVSPGCPHDWLSKFSVPPGAGSRVQASSPQPLDMSAWLPEASAQAGSPQPEQQQDEALPGLGGGVHGRRAAPTVADRLPGPIAAALSRMGVEAPKPAKAPKV